MEKKILSGHLYVLDEKYNMHCLYYYNLVYESTGIDLLVFSWSNKTYLLILGKQEIPKYIRNIAKRPCPFFKTNQDEFIYQFPFSIEIDIETFQISSKVLPEFDWAAANIPFGNTVKEILGDDNMKLTFYSLIYKILKQKNLV